MGRQLWRFVGFDLLQRVVGVGGREVEEDLGNARQQSARALHRLKRVRERRPRRIVGDLFHFGQLIFHACLNRRLVVAVLYLVERRRVKRQSAFSEERVGGGWRNCLRYRRERSKYQESQGQD